MNSNGALDVWNSLVQGESLDRLRLSTKDGRIDLSGLVVPDLKVVDRRQTPIAEVATKEVREIRGARLQNLDLSGSRLRSLRLLDSELNNCKFDDCDLKSFNPSNTVFQDCTFVKANLHGASLGIASVEGPRRGKRNVYLNVDFSGADLRGTLYVASEFSGCTFANSKLSKIDFARTSFANCRFEGELSEVQFWRTRPWLKEEDVFPANEMLNVDFSRAKLHWVEFRGLSLDHVQLPNDSDHIVIEEFASVLDGLLAALKCDPADQTSKRLIAIFEVYRKWAPPHGKGIINRCDLAEDGEESVNRVLKLLRDIGARTSLNTQIN